MHIDELHKFSDGILNDVRTALNDRLKGIRIKYLPQTIWRQSDRDKAGAMIQAIDKQLKTRRIMRSLEKFIGGDRTRPKHADWAIFSSYYCNLPTPNDLGEWIFKDIMYHGDRQQTSHWHMFVSPPLAIVLHSSLEERLSHARGMTLLVSIPGARPVQFSVLTSFPKPD
ncbi:hypothetical protein Tco_1055577 [Tanacetum coccineum]|uniref:Uncharacterized protein n=1 Tax=Tanacetum coccineum TaxID=301880 RepID=A0ABQ5H0Q9_9ASTR